MSCDSYEPCYMFLVLCSVMWEEYLLLITRVSSKYLCNLRQVIKYRLLDVTKEKLYGTVLFFCFIFHYQ